MAVEGEKKEELHNEHKRRLRTRFLNEGGSSFYEHEILEMLLNYAVVRGDTNATAHRLINKFGSLDGVFEANFEELLKVDGVGEKSAALLKMQYELFRVYETAKYKIKNTKYTTEGVIQYLHGLFFKKQNEVLYMICVDNRDYVIKTKKITVGAEEVNFAIREIVSEVMATNTSAVILAHNHPNGLLKPSTADIQSTQVVEDVLSALSVKLIDHFVFCEGKCLSMKNKHIFVVEEDLNWEE